MSDATRPVIGVLTVSDRASQGVYEDRSGPAIEAALRDYLATECDFDKRVIADERELIGATIRELAERGCCLICTTGGTGPSPRDVTPEATSALLDRPAPGLVEMLLRAALQHEHHRRRRSHRRRSTACSRAATITWSS